MKFSSSDHRYMTRAIELAKKSYKKIVLARNIKK